MNAQLCEKSKLEYLKINNDAKKAIFILHGYGANMMDLYGLGQVLDPEKKFNWYFPNAPLEVEIGPHMTGRAWFPIDMMELQRAMMSGEFRGFEDKQPEHFHETLAIAKSFIDHHANEYEEILIGGFSQGSMVTSHLLGSFGDKLKGYLCFSGTLLAKDALSDELEKASTIPFFQSHGKMDQVLEFRQAMNLFEFLKLNRLQGEFIPFTGGHEIPEIVIRKAKEFLSRLV